MNRFDPSPNWKHPVFLIGFILGGVGWWVAFIAMAVAESDLSECRQRLWWSFWRKKDNEGEGEEAGR